jgi:hypothetical protein
MAFENRMVKAEAIEAMEFQDLSMQFGVSGVPHTVINAGAGEVIGASPENRLVLEITQALKNKRN